MRDPARSLGQKNQDHRVQGMPLILQNLSGPIKDYEECIPLFSVIFFLMPCFLRYRCLCTAVAPSIVLPDYTLVFLFCFFNHPPTGKRKRPG